MKNPVSINFLLLLGLVVSAAAVIVYAPQFEAFGTFAFVLTGWVVGLCFHEYAHAVSAARFGDYTIRERGYLTLDPVTYINGPMSFVLPVIILAIGGIALPGAAVMIRPDLIRKRWQQSLISLAGPVVTLVFALVTYGVAQAIYAGDAESILGDAVMLLAFFNLMAFVLNMLPIPGFDGFGVIVPLLPNGLRQQAEALERIPWLSIGLLIVIFFIGFRYIAGLVFLIADLLGLEIGTAFRGYERFTFWN